jgi:SAM-dependent methyltransferase
MSTMARTPRHRHAPRHPSDQPARPASHDRSQSPRGPRRPVSPAGPTSWEHVASWYDKLVGEDGSDYHRHVIIPAALRLLDIRPGSHVLDVACGQGVLIKPLLERGAAQVVGIDASPSLIESATARFRDPRVKLAVGDARDLGPALGPLAHNHFDAAASLMAVHDFDPIEPCFSGVGAALKPGGVCVLILMHPCFRIPRQSSWGWDEDKRTQYRRLDRYLTPLAVPITVSPGKDATRHTTFFHRPLAAYFDALGAGGMGVTHVEELSSHRRSEPGGRSRAENRARDEFPIFLALRAVKGM